MPTPNDATATSPDIRETKSHVLQGSSAAGARAVGMQIIAFYFRAPVKSFFRMRVDYLQVARALHNPSPTSTPRWSLSQTTPGLLAHAVRTHGWRFLPLQVFPPLFANASIGAVLYTTYLQVLSTQHAPCAAKTKRVLPPPPPTACFLAGAAAGTLQSVLLAPLDALAAGELMRWQAWRQLRPRMVFAGYPLSLAKEALGYGVFFAAFEAVKQQAYFAFVGWWYAEEQQRVIRPHYALEPVFLLLAGASASAAQQAIQLPINRVQGVHAVQKTYARTLRESRVLVRAARGWRQWLWRGMAMNTIRHIPSTSAGLFVFELFRRRFTGEEYEEATTYEIGGRTLVLT